ncbi:DCTN1 [Mytilus edulis]|uniref:DCTN1 n=1 Tax=Mytilus edulis TaxID=6550 RepID=A0A8S3TF91_MYTED|nr:DCTN1 [Mytilus edulis]
MVAGAMNKLANAMENGEYDFDGTHEKMPLAPVKVRADMLRTQIADIELMKHRMATKDEEIIELKKKLLMKQEELSSQQVRLGLLEKKVENATRDSDDRTDQMQRKMDDQLAQFKKKEKQYEETLDSLQADIDALEQEKYELKERLKVLSKSHCWRAYQDKLQLLVHYHQWEVCQQLSTNHQSFNNRLLL